MDFDVLFDSSLSEHNINKAVSFTWYYTIINTAFDGEVYDGVKEEEKMEEKNR